MRRRVPARPLRLLPGESVERPIGADDHGAVGPPPGDPGGAPAIEGSGSRSADPQDPVCQVQALAGASAGIDPALLDAAMRGWSANTRRAFRSDLALWARWCQRRRIAPRDAGPELVAAWVRALAGIDASDETVRAVATIERYLVHLGWAYRMAGLADPTAAPLVRFERKAARKELGVRQRQARAIRFKGDIADLDSPAAGVCLTHLLKACRRDALGLRDAALLRVAYDTGARRSELVGIDVAHLEGPDAEGAGILAIPSSKTDREKRGAEAYLSPASMQAIARWRQAADIRSGPLFRRVHVHFDGSVDRIGSGRLHAGSVALIYRRLVRSAWDKKLLGPMSEAELEAWLEAVSSHSIRVGVAQDNFAAGEGLPAIMQAYRWRDARTVMRYGARLATRSGASARLARRFADDLST